MKAMVIAVALIVACGYAALVTWISNHPVHGAYWRAHDWFEVVIGNGLIIVTMLLLTDLRTAVTLFAINCLWGLPMIIATLVANMQRKAGDGSARRQSLGAGER